MMPARGSWPGWGHWSWAGRKREGPTAVSRRPREESRQRGRGVDDIMTILSGLHNAIVAMESGRFRSDVVLPVCLPIGLTFVSRNAELRR